MNPLDLLRSSQKKEDVLDENPFLNARRTLNEYNGALVNSRQLWQAVAFTSLMIALGAVAGVIYFASQSSYIPYVVEVDKLGQGAAVKRDDRALDVDERVVHAYLAAFVNDVRMVTFDRRVQNDAIWRAYSML